MRPWKLTDDFNKKIGHISYAAWSFVQHFTAIGETKLELQFGNTQSLGQNRRFFSRATLKLDGWHWKTIGHFFWATSSFVHHFLTICEVKLVRKRKSGIITSVTLIFDLWPWSFAWTSPLSMVISSENFRMIRWQEHCQKGVTDGRTGRRADGKKCSKSCLVRAKNDVEVLNNRF